MAKASITVTIDSGLIAEIDRLVACRMLPARSPLIEAALREKLRRLWRTRLARESASVDPREEKSLAEEGLRME